jgi:nucleolar protein 56
MKQEQLHILYEHASGYAVFRVKEFEEISVLKASVQKCVSNYTRFSSMVQLVAHTPFKSAQAALDNMNALSEGTLPEDLNVFLSNNLPASKKKSIVVLGVADPKLGSSIQETLGIQCSHTDAVPEILRGVRLHASQLISDLSEKTMANAEVSLSRAFSRCKVKFNVKRVDNMIIQSIALLDQLEKDLNVYSMRLREWYSYHFPELIKFAKDNYTFARVAKLVGNRKEIEDEAELVSQLEAIFVEDPTVAQAVVNASKSSMGMELSSVDLVNISTFANKVINLAEYRQQLTQYMINKMNTIAPNLSALIGETLGARLISKAGSLINLAKCPASTIQVLGAEKSLFRALKKKVGTPKYGLLYHSSFIGRSEPAIKGKVSRLLANKCGVASRIDFFLEKPTSLFGEKLKGQVEEKLKFFASGEFPRANADVMKEAVDEYNLSMNSEKKKRKDKKKSKKSRNAAEEEEEMEAVDA